MKYPSGAIVQVGDLIWWDGGLCVGYVQAVAETQPEYESWGLNSPHIFVSNHHPFDPSLKNGVAYDLCSFAEEGIDLLTPPERDELATAIAKARTLASLNFDYVSFAVFAVVENSRQVGWKFSLFNKGQEVEQIEVAVSHKKP